MHSEVWEALSILQQYNLLKISLENNIWIDVGQPIGIWTEETLSIYTPNHVT